MRDVLSIQHEITKAARDSLVKQGFLEIIPPVLGPVTDPGLRGAKRISVDFYGKEYKLMSSMILYKMLAASALGKIFAFSPCIRKESEKSAETGRHLSEFWQIDCEIPEATRDDAMSVAEQLLHDVIKHVVEKKSETLKKLDSEVKIPRLPFKRLTHSEAIEMSRRLGFDVKDGEEIPWEAEKAISMEFDEPFFITDYPTGSRGFYDKISEKDPKKLLAFDLIYPQGFGEAVSGSKREDVYEHVVQKIRSVGEDPQHYAWYLELLKRGKIKPSAGFGFGLERMTRFICGLQKISDATPFPKLPGVHSI